MNYPDKNQISPGLSVAGLKLQEGEKIRQNPDIIILK
jgi:hypothetical protein